MKVPASRYIHLKIMIARMLKNRFFIIAVFFLGIAVGLFLYKINIFKQKTTTYLQIQRLYPGNGHLVNPLMSVENPQDNDPKLEEIKYAIEEYINKSKERGDVSSVSVYLRNLNYSTWIGVNEDENYAAASLLKVPLMMAYLKLSEKDPSILNKEIKYDTEINIQFSQNMVPKNSLQLGDAYTVDELLSHMIVNSDNIASGILLNNIDLKLFSKVYSDLKIPIPDLTESENQISAKDYAAFFRAIYNCTYLTEDLSEKAIELLSKTEFKDGIVAGVPDDITIAHKFAERKYAGDIYSLKGSQLHDCGIVYYSKSPYLICVMTRGKDFNTLKEIIKNISKTVYEHEKMATNLL